MAACNKMMIKGLMVDNSTKWSGLHPNKSQTSLFREIVPIDAVDFTPKFQSTGLSQIFTCDRIRTGEGFNCNHLYRDIRTVPAIIVYNDKNNTVVAPLGEPGRDVDKDKAGHLLIVSHSEEGPVTFNDLLPSTSSEVDHLGDRIQTARNAARCLVEDAKVIDCGDRVVSKVRSMGLSTDMGIQEFFSHQIINMKESVRLGHSNGGEGPGYKLIGNDGTDYCTDSDKVVSEIKRVFDGSLKPRLFIQGTDRNTQLLSHIHLFMTEGEDLSTTVLENYIDVEIIHEIKEEFLADVPLTRVKTPPPPIDDGDSLSRTSSAMGGVSRNYSQRDD